MKIININKPINQHSPEAVAMIKGQLATNGVNCPAIINAIATTDRSHFVPDYARDVAYIDEEIRLCANRYLLEPLLFAQMLQYANIQKQHKVLDIGAGYGYSSSVIAQLADQVFGIEESAELVSAARKKLSLAGVNNVEIITAPLENGYKSHAPYDRILINGAQTKVPVAIENQLAEGGIVVAIIAASKIFATNKILCKITIGQKTFATKNSPPVINYIEKQTTFAFYLKKPTENNVFKF